jgi:hypothetical protein
METNKLIKLTDSEYFGEKNFFNFSLIKELLKSPLTALHIPVFQKMMSG